MAPVRRDRAGAPRPPGSPLPRRAPDHGARGSRGLGDDRDPARDAAPARGEGPDGPRGRASWSRSPRGSRRSRAGSTGRRSTASSRSGRGSSSSAAAGPSATSSTTHCWRRASGPATRSAPPASSPSASPAAPTVTGSAAARRPPPDRPRLRLAPQAQRRDRICPAVRQQDFHAHGATRRAPQDDLGRAAGEGEERASRPRPVHHAPPAVHGPPRAPSSDSSSPTTDASRVETRGCSRRTVAMRMGSRRRASTTYRALRPSASGTSAVSRHSVARQRTDVGSGSISRNSTRSRPARREATPAELEPPGQLPGVLGGHQRGVRLPEP